MKILVLNSGSSSQKTCLYEIGDALPANPPVPLWKGRIEWDGDTAAVTVRNSNGVVKNETVKISSRELLLNHLLGTSWSGETRGIASATEIDAVGHRVVHGGHVFQDPVVITKDVYSALAGLSQFAPLHIQSECLQLEGM